MRELRVGYMSNELAVIVLNWNNAEDTIECLKSLHNQTFKNFTIIVVDNGSTSDTIKSIEDWICSNIASNQLKICDYEYMYDLDIKIDFDVIDFHKKELVLIKNIENLGFAKGNNVAIKAILKNNYFKDILLLNNDTVLENDCIEILSTNMKKNSKIKIAVPQILYYDSPKIIWNCGGKINSLGRRRYYYALEDTKNCPEENFNVSFVTGCALFINKSIFEDYGLLTERFFFGEEDWEFSLRMMDANESMYCIPKAKLYHKVGASTNEFFDEGSLFKTCVNYVNRFINFKSRYHNVYWYFWREIYFIYISLFLKKKKVQIPEIRACISLIRKYSDNYDNVSKNIIEKIRVDAQGIKNTIAE